ncbi:hypothetical protein CBL_12089 [Carabus blaptoides fortunei]
MQKVANKKREMETKHQEIITLWAETDSPKDSNAITSAIYDLLQNANFSDTTDTVRVFADGCGGQNKNSVMMSMIRYWLALEAPAHIKTVEFIFPILSHSFIPPDRIFGLIEKEKHYGDDWRQDNKLAFYKVIDRSGPTTDEHEDETDHNESEENTDMRI